jgi:hypothetical protein
MCMCTAASGKHGSAAEQLGVLVVRLLPPTRYNTSRRLRVLSFERPEQPSVLL